MGSPTSKARTRFKHRRPGAAAPALFGVAATLALTNAPAFASAPSDSRPAHPVARVSVYPPAATWLSAIRSAPIRESSGASSYAVKPGDSLSAIAEWFYQDPGYWPVLYWANHGKIQYADVITAGQVLAVPVKPAKIPGAPSVLAPAPAPAPSTASTWVPSEGATSATAGTAQTAPVQTVSTAGDGSFQSCVVARESGGNSQVMNSTGHYGLYQFSSSTWAAYSGNPADFGNASVAEQNQVFNNAIAAGGASNWSAYDGC